MSSDHRLKPSASPKTSSGRPSGRRSKNRKEKRRRHFLESSSDEEGHPEARKPVASRPRPKKKAIPGFYYDEKKNRYFPIEGMTLSAAATSVSTPPEKLQIRSDNGSIDVKINMISAHRCQRIRNLHCVLYGRERGGRASRTRDAITARLTQCQRVSETAANTAMCLAYDNNLRGRSPAGSVGEVYSDEHDLTLWIAGLRDGWITHGSIHLARTRLQQTRVIDHKSGMHALMPTWRDSKITTIEYIPSLDSLLSARFGDQRPGRLELSSIEGCCFELKKGSIWDAAAHPQFGNQSRLLVAGATGGLHTFSIGDGNRTLRKRYSFPNNSDVWSLEFSPTGNEILCGTRRGDLCLIDLRSRQNRKKKETSRFKRKSKIQKRMLQVGAGVTWLKGLPGGNGIVTAGIDGSLGIWDLRYPKGKSKDLKGHQNSVVLGLRGAIDNEGRYVFLGGSDSKIRSWSLQSGALISELPLAPAAAAASPTYGINDNMVGSVAAWCEPTNSLLIGTECGVMQLSLSLHGIPGDNLDNVRCVKNASSF